MATRHNIISEVMREKSIIPGDVFHKSNHIRGHRMCFNPLKLRSFHSSPRYILVKGFAWYYTHQPCTHESCTHSWSSFHSWCIIDLRQQRIRYKYCQRCNLWKVITVKERESQNSQKRHLREWQNMPVSNTSTEFRRKKEKKKITRIWQILGVKGQVHITLKTVRCANLEDIHVASLLAIDNPDLVHIQELVINKLDPSRSQS